MNELPLTVTEAARNFADCVNRAHYQGQAFLLLKNGVPFARLVPAGKANCYGGDLAEALATVELSDKDAQAWNRDLRAARKKLRVPTDKWQ